MSAIEECTDFVVLIIEWASRDRCVVGVAAHRVSLRFLHAHR